MGGFSQASFRVGAAGGWKRRLARSKLRGTEQWAESGDARLLALDFDGVVVDSVGESSISAYAAAAKKWPDVFVRATEEDRERVLKGLRRVRPCVTTGFENLVQARLLQERQASEEEILANWEQLLWHYMEEWGTTRGELVDTFGQERNDWIEQDFQSWLSANAIYDGVADALSQCLRNDSSLVYIVTTKQQHFVHALLGHLAGIEFPMSRIISTTESGTPKGSVLQVCSFPLLSARHQSTSRLTFFQLDPQLPCRSFKARRDWLSARWWKTSSRRWRRSRPTRR